MNVNKSDGQITGLHSSISASFRFTRQSIHCGQNSCKSHVWNVIKTGACYQEVTIFYCGIKSPIVIRFEIQKKGLGRRRRIFCLSVLDHSINMGSVFFLRFSPWLTESLISGKKQAIRGMPSGVRFQGCAPMRILVPNKSIIHITPWPLFLLFTSSSAISSMLSKALWVARLNFQEVSILSRNFWYISHLQAQDSTKRGEFFSVQKRHRYFQRHHSDFGSSPGTIGGARGGRVHTSYDGNGWNDTNVPRDR